MIVHATNSFTLGPLLLIAGAETCFLLSHPHTLSLSLIVTYLHVKPKYGSCWASLSLASLRQRLSSQAIKTTISNYTGEREQTSHTSTIFDHHGPQEPHFLAP